MVLFKVILKNMLQLILKANSAGIRYGIIDCTKLGTIIDIQAGIRVVFRFGVDRVFARAVLKFFKSLFLPAVLLYYCILGLLSVGKRSYR